MIENGILKVVRILMAVTTDAGVMVCWRCVARNAVLVAYCRVIKRRVLEITRIAVTIAASASIVIGRRRVAG